MKRYRVLEIKDKLISQDTRIPTIQKGEPYWVVQKKILGIWWTEYFEEHSENGATFYDRDTAICWWEYHCDKGSRTNTRVIAQN